MFNPANLVVSKDPAMPVEAEIGSNHFYLCVHKCTTQSNTIQLRLVFCLYLLIPVQEAKESC